MNGDFRTREAMIIIDASFVHNNCYKEREKKKKEIEVEEKEKEKEEEKDKEGEKKKRGGFVFRGKLAWVFFPSFFLSLSSCLSLSVFHLFS